jgi:short subunit dehydrogenase-like uncharacterized protein
MAERSYDVVLFGATGFTGRQATRYLKEHVPSGLRWALAGRNRERLETLAREFDAPAIEVADSSDAEAISALVARTRVIASCAGPFAVYSEPVVAACVLHGTDYVDLSGELPWVRSLIERFHDKAAEQGTRVIPFCGVDSVPSDLGVQALARWMAQTWGQPTRKVSASFVFRGGSYNGGTLATMLLMAENGQFALIRDPLFLNPLSRMSDDERARSPDFAGTRFDRLRGVWLVPFEMAGINTRVVRRSNALLSLDGAGYGPEFTYEEASERRSRRKAVMFAAAAPIVERLVNLGAFRALLRRFGPKPGEGASEEVMQRASVHARFVGEAQDGRLALAALTAQGDASNKVTVKCLCEAALALATQKEQLPGGAKRGGILTPAYGLGSVLFDRLRAAGVGWEIGPAPGA